MGNGQGCVSVGHEQKLKVQGVWHDRKTKDDYQGVGVGAGAGGGAWHYQKMEDKFQEERHSSKTTDEYGGEWFCHRTGGDFRGV
mmetsp:Transcript_16605/g.27225  ORF Transcript_16605/g.27225 Transcript_16605/m.27225 type:complete len:84 (+) Transcript_16605:567-818(+)